MVDTIQFEMGSIRFEIEFQNMSIVSFFKTLSHFKLLILIWIPWYLDYDRPCNNTEMTWKW